MSGGNLGSGGQISKQRPTVPTIYRKTSELNVRSGRGGEKLNSPSCQQLRTTLQSMARNFTERQLFLIDMQIQQHDFRFRAQRAKQNRSLTFKRRQLQIHSLELWYLATVQVADMKRKPRVEYQKVTSIPPRASFQKYRIKIQQYTVVCAFVVKQLCRHVRRQTRNVTSLKGSRLSIIVPNTDRLSQGCSGYKMRAFYFCKTFV